MLGGCRGQALLTYDSMKVLVLSELWYPQGGGAELATHLVIDALQKEGFKVIVLTGSEQHDRPIGVRYVPIPLLKALSKNSSLEKSLLGRDVLASLIKEADVVYVPRLANPVIPLAKELGKKAIVHLHDYQPISYERRITSTGRTCIERNTVKN